MIALRGGTVGRRFTLLYAAVFLLLGRAMASRVLRPLRQITAATRRISADSLDRRLAVTGPADEVRDLADTIDDLLERLETAFAAQRTFAANASHELRTPLATIRASADVAAAKPGAPPQTIALAARTRNSTGSTPSWTASSPWPAPSGWWRWTGSTFRSWSPGR